MKILIRNGEIVTSEEIRKSDILIDDGKIAMIENDIQERLTDRVIDATNLYILPGGIDTHVHMHLPSPAGYSSDDFFSGSRAALFGGTTTLLDFVTPLRGQSLTDALEQRKEEAKDSMVDFSFHISPVEWQKTTGDEIIKCIANGFNSFKVYMAYKSTVGLGESDLFNVMHTVGLAGGMVTVHCELGDEIEVLRDNYYNENHTEPYYHPLSRPADLESAAVAKAIELANNTGCTLYIVHVSAKESLNHIREARAKGQRVFAETCPQYLLLDDSKYQGKFNQTAPYVISPPLRRKEDNDALWDAIADGIINTVGTDHCPFNMSQKETGLSDFRKIPNGAGGVEHRLALLYTYGVLKEKITLMQLAGIWSTLPAKIFGLYPRKGEIAVGSDADMVIWNPNSTAIISVENHHQNCDINIYEGLPVNGKAEYVISNGNIIIQNGKMTDQTVRGKILKR